MAYGRKPAMPPAAPHPLMRVIPISPTNAAAKPIHVPRSTSIRNTAIPIIPAVNGSILIPPYSSILLIPTATCLADVNICKMKRRQRTILPNATVTLAGQVGKWTVMVTSPIS